MIDVALKGKVGQFDLDVAFTAPSSGITTIFGPSGSGKTSLMRAMAGLLHLKGHVKINNDAWQSEHGFIPVHKRRVGFVFQEDGLFSHLNVRGNLDFARKRSQGEVEFDEICDKLKICELLGRSVSKLSGGERQRVALARTLMSAPSVLLMDEPLSSLDQTAKAGIIPLIAAIGRNLPIIYVSHDPGETEQLSDHRLYLNAGKLVQSPETEGGASLEGTSESDIRTLALAAIRAGIRL